LICRFPGGSGLEPGAANQALERGLLFLARDRVADFVRVSTAKVQFGLPEAFDIAIVKAFLPNEDLKLAPPSDLSQPMPEGEGTNQDLPDCEREQKGKEQDRGSAFHRLACCAR
jgi:hypothetical protein